MDRHWVKYPRTPHLPFSPGIASDDVILNDTSTFVGRRVIVTVKMDGESRTFYRDGTHARSLDSESASRPELKQARSLVKQLHARIRLDIPEGWRVCGEDVTIRHSIAYTNLPDIFLMFSIWTDQNVCLAWDETREWADLLDVSLVPVLYDGLWDETVIRNLYRPYHDGNPCEGFVVRVADRFAFADFSTHVAKFVRAGHVTTTDHWTRGPFIRNHIGAK